LVGDNVPHAKKAFRNFVRSLPQKFAHLRISEFEGAKNTVADISVFQGQL
jgi:hypothetical protein